MNVWEGVGGIEGVGDCCDNLDSCHFLPQGLNLTDIFLEGVETKAAECEGGISLKKLCKIDMFANKILNEAPARLLVLCVACCF